MNDKPLFLPLGAQFFDDFMSGEKTAEYRLFGPRWNLKTCIPGRQIMLSRGYGQQNRAMGIIKAVHIFELIELGLELQDSLRFLYNRKRIENPEVIAIEITDIHRIFYQDRVYFAFDMGKPGGDKSAEVTYKLSADNPPVVIVDKIKFH